MARQVARALTAFERHRTGDAPSPGEVEAGTGTVVQVLFPAGSVPASTWSGVRAGQQP